jgi:GT2 family glycosyltransferase
MSHAINGLADKPRHQLSGIDPEITQKMVPGCSLSIVIVSFNTREVLRRCLLSLESETQKLAVEVFVVDNGSDDGSSAMVADEFPDVALLNAGRNLGFAAANNLAFQIARGEYIVLLNSDAFLRPRSLRRALEHMQSEPWTGLAGGRLIGEDESWQPSARQFPSVLNDLISLSGLAHRYRNSRFWGRADRTWADPMLETVTEWVPGAFSIIRASVLEQVGGFDESFFLYYEEVDLCRRINAAGYAVRYWPDVVVVHLGGESSKSMSGVVRSRSGAQLALWKFRSGFLYYRKHHGIGAWQALAMESGWHAIRFLRNRASSRPARREKAAESRTMIALLKRAWTETHGGRYSPPKPW